MSQTKRIQSISFKRIPDSAGDDGYLGSYSDTRVSEFSIDRRHTAECQAVSPSKDATVDKLERIIVYLDSQRLTTSTDESEDGNSAYTALVTAQDILIDAQYSVTACDCNGGVVSDRSDYRYFNPSPNYVDPKGNLREGNTADDVRKYVAQDYDLMERCNAGEWGYMGIQAIAKIEVSGVSQTVTSAGLWGIESYSDESYFQEVESDELSELRIILHTMGFSKRSIAAAVKQSEVSK
jgi:hypothetical protein